MKTVPLCFHALVPRLRPLACVFAILGMASCDDATPTPSGPQLEEVGHVVFANPVLEERIRQLLDIPSGTLTETDMLDLVELHVAVGRGIEDLAGLEHARNLERLSLRGQAVHDVAPLGALTHLVRLDLTGNAIEDIEALSGLTSLEVLHLADNQISDAGPLSALTGLQVLDLTGNAITDIEALSELTSLEVLHLADNQIADAGPLSALPTGLQVLDLTGNGIADATPFGGPAAPLALLLDDNALTDLSPLVANNGLQDAPSHVSVRGNPLSEDARCDHVAELRESGVVVDVDLGCPSEPGGTDPKAVTTDRTWYLSGYHAIGATFTNLGDAAVYGNKCSTGEDWEFQLRIERFVGDQWETVYDPVTLLCGGLQEIQPGESMAFAQFPLGTPTGLYRLVWPRVYTDEGLEQPRPLDERISEPFNVVAP